MQTNRLADRDIFAKLSRLDFSASLLICITLFSFNIIIINIVNARDN